MDLGRVLEAVGSGERAASFEVFADSLDRHWIEQALAATGTATVRRRKLPAEQVVWIVIGMALFRDRSIQEVVHHLELVLPGRAPAARRASAPSSALVQARNRLSLARPGDLRRRWLRAAGPGHARERGGLRSARQQPRPGGLSPAAPGRAHGAALSPAGGPEPGSVVGGRADLGRAAVGEAPRSFPHDPGSGLSLLRLAPPPRHERHRAPLADPRQVETEVADAEATGTERRAGGDPRLAANAPDPPRAARPPAGPRRALPAPRLPAPDAAHLAARPGCLSRRRDRGALPRALGSSSSASTRSRPTPSSARRPCVAALPNACVRRSGGSRSPTTCSACTCSTWRNASGWRPRASASATPCSSCATSGSSRRG